MLSRMSDLQYPIGKFEMVPDPTPEQRAGWIDDIATLPAKLRLALAALPEGGVDRPYRPGGWTVRQLVHHIADSHVNSYIRLRLALTEETPAIKPYNEVAWAQLPDASTAPIEVSLQLIDALHQRWAMLLRTLSASDFRRGLIHPAESGPKNIDWLLQLYAWHSRHHTAHVRQVV